MTRPQARRIPAPPGTGEDGPKRKGERPLPDSSPKKPGDGPGEKSPPDFGLSVESG